MTLPNRKDLKEGGLLKIEPNGSPRQDMDILVSWLCQHQIHLFIHSYAKTHPDINSNAHSKC